nr:hypothetical protein GCM10020093_025950 [Planobispora longispora]
MVALLCSYLFDEPTHLNDIYDRPGDSTAQFWTLPFVPGPRFGADKPVYVLTSGFTFSGAEEFAYDLQSRKRATVVGERTRRAHPGVRYRVGAHLKSAVPCGRAINPVTGTNWEGTGIVPDIDLPAEHAFVHAYGLALRHVLELGEEGARRGWPPRRRRRSAAWPDDPAGPFPESRRPYGAAGGEVRPAGGAPPSPAPDPEIYTPAPATPQVARAR